MKLFQATTKTFILFTCLVAASVARSEDVPVYLAAGQSNAKTTWSDSIQSTLRLLKGDTSLVVNSMHSGAWLNSWFQTEPQTHYDVDLAAINSTMTSIISNGDTPVFSGLFWFQGEGDSGDYGNMNLYESRFHSMLNQYEFDLGVMEIPYAVMVIDADPNFPIAAGRTPEKIENMRSILQQLGAADNAIAVDTRGYERSDTWHLTTNALESLGTETATRFQNNVSAVPEPNAAFISLTLLWPALRRRKRELH